MSTAAISEPLSFADPFIRRLVYTPTDSSVHDLSFELANVALDATLQFERASLAALDVVEHRRAARRASRLANSMVLHGMHVVAGGKLGEKSSKRIDEVWLLLSRREDDEIRRTALIVGTIQNAAHWLQNPLIVNGEPAPLSLEEAADEALLRIHEDDEALALMIDVSKLRAAIAAWLAPAPGQRTPPKYAPTIDLLSSVGITQTPKAISRMIERARASGRR